MIKKRPLHQPWTVNLRGFIALWLVVGTTGGLFLRWWVLRPRFDVATRIVEGFQVHTVWRRHYGTPPRLVYLLAFPDGNQYGGGSSFSPTSDPGSDGVHRHVLGIFVNRKNLLDDQPDCHYWVYMNVNSNGDARPLEVDSSLPALTREEFSELESTRLWSDYLRPALVLESQRFDEWFLEKEGIPNPLSRFSKKPSTTGELKDRQAPEEVPQEE